MVLIDGLPCFAGISCDLPCEFEVAVSPFLGLVINNKGCDLSP